LAERRAQNGLQKRLRGLAPRALANLLRGIEKESLRANPNGSLALTPHPPALGSALTHPHITTDFSEAQVELITSVHSSPEACLEQLMQVHEFVYRQTRLLQNAGQQLRAKNLAPVDWHRYETSACGMAELSVAACLTNLLPSRTAHRTQDFDARDARRPSGHSTAPRRPTRRGCERPWRGFG